MIQKIPQMKTDQVLKSSFRDPSGFLFRREGVLYRQINQSYQAHYDQLMQSGLYAQLVKAGMLIPHQEIEIAAEQPEISYRIIQPEKIGFISYPYEWSFSQFKDAALLTLRIEKKAIELGMSLKDASAYNIQFRGGKPVLIDTLSFEPYIEGQPWVAYRQFCQHFLAPLALMAAKDIRLNQLLRIYIDGVPLDLASELLPWNSRLNFGLMMHIHTHASAQKRYAGQAVKPESSTRQVGRMAFLGLIESLESTVRKLEWKPSGTEWADYYDITNYSTEAFDQKKALVKEFIEQSRPQIVWDLGANTGEFSRIACEAGAFTVAFDIDPSAVEKGYKTVRKNKEKNLLPLVLDLTNPSPALGWQNQERMSLVERGPADTVMALALIHHIAISNNVPLPRVAEFFSRLGNWLVIEFVPKEDSQVQKLLSTREDIFSSYTQSCFEDAFNTLFTIRDVKAIPGTKRHLYLMEKKQVSE
jgi:hypothetical protein